MHRRVELAILESPIEDILRQGLACERCDVAVMTAFGNGASSGEELESAEDRVRAMRVMIESVAHGGSVVLMADDPLAVSLVGHCSGSVIYVAGAANHPVLARHRRKGGRAVYLRDAVIRLAEGSMEETLLPLAKTSLVRMGQPERELETMLTAIAAAWALRLPKESLAARLEMFVSMGTNMVLQRQG